MISDFLDFLMFLLFFGFIPLIVVGIILSVIENSTKKETKPDINKSSLSYEELLNSEEWQQKRLSILKRDYFKCRYCGSKHNLQVHHKYYKKYPDGQKVKPWNYPDDALITLCRECHKKVHSKKRIKVYYTKYDNETF